MGRMLARATGGVALAQVRRVAAVSPRNADGLVARVYRQMAADFGMLAPPVALHSAAPAVLAASWSVLRETTLATGIVSRADKETVATAVSAANRCPYCVDIHGGTLAGLLRKADGDAIASDRLDSIPDERHRALARWARGTAAGGHTVGVAPPFRGSDAPELVGVAVTFHYLNRMVNLFLQESPLPPTPRPARRGVRRGRRGYWRASRPATCRPGPRAICCPMPRCRPISRGHGRSHTLPTPCPAPPARSRPQAVGPCPLPYASS
jgi:AhpD family alkylhydroperoxidase